MDGKIAKVGMLYNIKNESDFVETRNRVVLRTDFARRLIKTRVPLWTLERINRTYGREVDRIVPCKDPYVFHSNTPFVKRIQLGEGHQGIGIDDETLDSLIKGEDMKRLIEYKPIGEFSDKDSHFLNYLFGEWLKEVPVLLNTLESR